MWQKVELCSQNVYSYLVIVERRKMELKLKQLRERAGYKRREDFAEVSGFPKRRIQSWENGERNPTFDDACKLADFLEVSLDELAGRTEFICQYSDPRQTAINEDFDRLDEPSKDSAAAAVRGMAIACAQASGPERAEDSEQQGAA